MHVLVNRRFVYVSSIGSETYGSIKEVIEQDSQTFIISDRLVKFNLDEIKVLS